jgi:hypothetical protein
MDNSPRFKKERKKERKDLRISKFPVNILVMKFISPSVEQQYEYNH